MIKTNELFEGHMGCLQGATPAQIRKAKELYEYIVNQAAKANYLNEGLDDKLDEGILTGLLGGVSMAMVGPIIGKAICKVLGVNENGTLGKLLTSSLVNSSIGYEIFK